MCRVTLSWSRSCIIRGPFDRVVEIKVDEADEVPGPAITAGLVAVLRGDEPTDHCDEAVDVAGIGDTGRVQQRCRACEHGLSVRSDSPPMPTSLASDQASATMLPFFASRRSATL
jgi:hypothetical protein